MPNWKKVIVSGSDAELNSLKVTTALTASGLHYPTSDGIEGQFLGTDGLGNLSFSNVTVSQVNTIAASFTATSSITVPHNFNSKNVIVSAYDNYDFYFIPQSIKLIDDNNVKLTFSNPSTGYVVIAKGGHIVSASMQGNQGFQGIQGSQGFQGYQGYQGYQGIQGTVGTQGFQGNQGIQGSTGISSGATYYLNQSINSDVSPYKELSLTPSGSQQTVTTNLTGNQQNILVSSFITPELGFAVIPAGVQRFHLHFLKPASNDNIDVYATIQLADSAGSPIGSIISTNIAALGWVTNTIPVEIVCDLVLPTTTIDPTNRMIVKLYLSNLDSSAHSVVWYTQGISYYSFIVTSTGVIGNQGPQGIIGTQGFQGFQGTQGTQGTTGTNGVQGFQGNQGNTGIQGTVGAQGFQGIQGTNGTVGTQGFQGTQGTQGNQGNQGAQGNQGPQGNQGTQGTQGNQGNTGLQGAAGAQGNQGPTGIQGTVGTQGATGASAGITSYTNPADNRVITSVSSTTINAESNLTFDGSVLTVTGTITETSSEKVKENIEKLINSLDVVKKLRGVQYNKKGNNIKEIGVIAEEINEILPQVVSMDLNGNPASVSYGRLTALLIEAIKELDNKINKLK